MVLAGAVVDVHQFCGYVAVWGERVVGWQEVRGGAAFVALYDALLQARLEGMRREHLKPAGAGRGQQDLVIGDGGLVAPLVKEALHHLNIVARVLGAGVVRSCRQFVHPRLEIVGIEVAVELRFEQALRFGSGVGEPL